MLTVIAVGDTPFDRAPALVDVWFADTTRPGHVLFRRKKGDWEVESDTAPDGATRVEPVSVEEVPDDALCLLVPQETPYRILRNLRVLTLRALDGATIDAVICNPQVARTVLRRLALAYLLKSCEDLDQPSKAEGPLLRALRCRPDYAHPVLLAASVLRQQGAVPSSLLHAQARAIDPAAVPDDPNEVKLLEVTVKAWFTSLTGKSQHDVLVAQTMWQHIEKLRTPTALLNEWQKRMFRLGWSDLKNHGLPPTGWWSLALKVVDKLLEGPGAAVSLNHYARMAILDAWAGTDPASIIQAARTALHCADQELTQSGESEDEFARSNRANAHRIIGRRLLADANSQEEQEAEAREHLRTAKATFEALYEQHRSDWLADRLAQTSLLSGDARRAHELYREIPSPTGRVYLGLVDACVTMGRYDEARSWLSEYSRFRNTGDVYQARARWIARLETSARPSEAEIIRFIAATDYAEDFEIAA